MNQLQKLNKLPGNERDLSAIIITLFCPIKVVK